MSRESDRLKGLVKEAYGALSGDDGLKADGKRDQRAAKTKEVVESALDKAKAALHHN